MSVPTGLWELIDSHNYDAYQQAAGVSSLYRTITRKDKYSVEITRDENKYTMTTICTTNKLYPPYIIMFKLGEEIVEGTPDGRTCKSIFTMERGKLVQLQRCEKGTSLIVREFSGDYMIVTLEANGVTSKLKYFKA